VLLPFPNSGPFEKAGIKKQEGKDGETPAEGTFVKSSKVRYSKEGGTKGAYVVRKKRRGERGLKGS